MIRTGLKVFFTGLALLGLLTLSPVWAAAGIYEAVVPVADRSAAARDQALQQALGEVLGRMTSSGAENQEAAAALLSNPGRYVQQYRYEGGAGGSPLQFRVTFDGTALEAAMRRQGVALWGRERPPLLLWLAYDDGRNRDLLGSDDRDEIHSALQDAAQRRGLTLMLPLLDLEDQSQVSYSDVWGGFLERVVSASRRYQAQVVLVGRVQRLGSAAWTGRWSLRVSGRDDSWQSGGADLAAMLDDGLGQAANRLATQLSTPTYALGATQVPLAVEGVANLADYARIDSYLRGLTSVQDVQLLAAQADRLEYLIDAPGGAQALAQAIQAGRILERADMSYASTQLLYNLRH